MRVETVLNHVESFKGFVYKNSWLDRGTETLFVEISSRKGSLVSCPRCARRCSGYDRQPVREFEAPPFRHLRIVYRYAPRRCDCPRCGVRTERPPWSTGKSPLTRSYAFMLARWAKRLPWNQVAKVFCCGWHQVFDAVSQAVAWGLAHRDVSGVVAIGVDEVYFGAKPGYRTLVYQICRGKPRLLAIAKGHKAEALSGILQTFGNAWCEGIRYICSDMWRAYLKTAKDLLPNAMHILDRFHIEKSLNEAVDKVRRAEAAELARHGLRVLKNLRYAFLKRPENLTEKQRDSLQSILHKRRLKSVRAYHWKEAFRPFWEYISPWHAQIFLRKWCRGAARSRLKPITTFVKTMQKHEQLILNWFRAKKQFSNAAVEAMNRGAGLVSNLARGFRNPEIMEIALFHALGDLPEPPEFTHRFS